MQRGFFFFYTDETSLIVFVLLVQEELVNQGTFIQKFHCLGMPGGTMVPDRCRQELGWKDHRAIHHLCSTLQGTKWGSAICELSHQDILDNQLAFGEWPATASMAVGWHYCCNRITFSGHCFAECKVCLPLPQWQWCNCRLCNWVQR